MTPTELDIQAACTCGACPTQYEGTVNGIEFYFRYRYGSWKFELYTTQAEGTGAIEDYIKSGNKGDSLSGVMDETEVMNIIQHCANEYFRGQNKRYF